MATALHEPYLGMGAFDIDMSTFDADFQMDDSVGISGEQQETAVKQQVLIFNPAENEQTKGLQSVVDYDKPTNMSQNVGLGAQEALPLFMCPSLQQRLSQDSQTSDQNFAVSMTNQYSAKIQKSRPSSSLHALNRVSPESRSSRRPRRCMTRTSTTPNPRLMTSQTLNSCQPPSSRNLKPLAHSVLRNKNQREAPNIQVPILPSKCTTDNDTSHTYSTMLREALALAKGSIMPYSSFSRRKAIDIINQVAKLVDQLDQIAIEEEKYGSAATDDDDLTQPSTNTEESLSNSELVDVDSGTDNTSVSSTSRQPVVENQSTVSVTDYRNESGHPPCLQCGIKSLYYCTREGCTYSTHSCAEWKRHEESQKHSQQERFMCLECPQSPPFVDVNGNPICEFCRTSFPSLGNLSAHYLQCQHAQRFGTTYGRKDRLIAHLRDHHTTNNANQVAAAGRFTVDSKWPRQCGFCGVFFKTWDERMGHVASHFQEGLDISAWKLPLPRSKDFHPTFKPQPNYGDDSDDDMDDTDGRPGHHKTGVMQDTSSASSSLKQNSNENLGPGKSHQRGRRHRNHSQPANQNNETIETTDPNHLWGTLVDKYCSYWTNPLACERASVTLERYLNDVEEPFHIQSSAESPGSPDRTLCRDTAAIGVKIRTSGADQKSTKQRLKGQRQTESNDESPASKVLGNSDTEPNSKTSHQHQRKSISCQELFSDQLILKPEAIPISLEQLVAEVKGIYAGLVMVEAECLEFDNEQASLGKANSGAELVRIVREHRAAAQARLSATMIELCSHLFSAGTYLSAACFYKLLIEEPKTSTISHIEVRLAQAAVRGFTKQDFRSKGLQLDYSEYQFVMASSAIAQMASGCDIAPSSWFRKLRTIKDQWADATMEIDRLREAISSFLRNSEQQEIAKLAEAHKLSIRLAQNCWNRYIRWRQATPLCQPALNEGIPAFYKCFAHRQSLRRDCSWGLSAFHKPRGFLYARFQPGEQLLPELLPFPKQTPLRLNGMNLNAPLHHVQNYAVPGFNSCLVWESILSPTIGLDFGCGFETSQSITRQLTIVIAQASRESQNTGAVVDNSVHDTQYSDRLPTQEAQQYILDSLKFEAMHDRYEAISEANDKTFNWILQVDIDEDTKWSNELRSVQIATNVNTGSSEASVTSAEGSPTGDVNIQAPQKVSVPLSLQSDLTGRRKVVDCSSKPPAKTFSQSMETQSNNATQGTVDEVIYSAARSLRAASLAEVFTFFGDMPRTTVVVKWMKFYHYYPNADKATDKLRRDELKAHLKLPPGCGQRLGSFIINKFNCFRKWGYVYWDGKHNVEYFPRTDAWLSPTWDGHIERLVDKDSTPRNNYREQPMYHYDSITHTYYHNQSPQSYASSNLSGPWPEGPEREDPNAHFTGGYLPLGPSIGLNEAQYRRTASFNSNLSFPMLRFLGERDLCYDTTEQAPTNSRFLSQDLHIQSHTSNKVQRGTKRSKKSHMSMQSSGSNDASFVSWVGGSARRTAKALSDILSLSDILRAQTTALCKGLALTDREGTHASEWSLVRLDAIRKLVSVERGKRSAKDDWPSSATLKYGMDTTEFGQFRVWDPEEKNMGSAIWCCPNCTSHVFLLWASVQSNLPVLHHRRSLLTGRVEKDTDQPERTN
jgi:hypothetical protein